MHQYEEVDHERNRRRANFQLEVIRENERHRIRHRLAALIALIVIAAGVIIFGVGL